MASRNCDRCGSRMSPRWPRKQVGGEMWCPSCVESDSHVQSTAASMTEKLAAGWSGEDVIRHELGRQKVHQVHVNGEHARTLCPEHLRIARAQSDFATGLAKQVGIGDRYPTIQVSPQHEGRCTECTRTTGTQSMEMPWNPRPTPGARPVHEERQPTPHNEGDDEGMGYQQGRAPYRPPLTHERHLPFAPSIQSLNRRAAIVLRPGDPMKLRTTATIRIQAHDSGDGETIFHCPFCGSGQVIARSDGTVECEFCSTAFTVQVQPQMPAFPQTIDGVPVDVPGMPAGGANANVPPGEGPPGAAGPDGDPGAVSGPPGAEPGADDDETEDGDSDGPPAFLKGSLLRTATGARLNGDQYMRHLAITHARHRSTVLAQIRNENGRA